MVIFDNYVSFSDNLKGYSGLPKKGANIGEEISNLVATSDAPVSKGFEYVGKGVGLLNLVRLPADIYKMYANGKKLGEGPAEARVDSAMNEANGVRGMLGHALSISWLLKVTKAVPTDALKFMKPLGIVAGAMGVISVAQDSMQLHGVVRFRKALSGNLTITELKERIEKTPDHRFKWAVGQDKTAVMKKIDDIAKDTLNQPERTAALTRTLKGRVNQKIASKSLSILTGIISLVAVILMIVCPLAAIPLAALAIGEAAFSIGQFIWDKVAEEQFKKQLQGI